MKRPRIYVDTSVAGGCFEQEFAKESRALFEMAEIGSACLVISDLLVVELLKAPPHVRETVVSLPQENVDRVAISTETERLRDCYLEAHVVGPGTSHDAHHVAIATVYDADMIVSWNFRHIVHYEKIRQFNAVNLREGYGTIEIYSPKEVV